MKTIVHENFFSLYSKIIRMNLLKVFVPVVFNKIVILFLFAR